MIIRLVATLAFGLVLATGTARADDNPKRKIAVLEDRAGSSALPGVGAELAAEIGRQTSLAILGPDQAKTIYGEQLEPAVVACSGDSACVAKIGNKLGAAEV